MADSDFVAPSGDHLASFSAFWKGANILTTGEVRVVLVLPPEHRARVLDLANNDGLAMNFVVHATELPEALEQLSNAAGIEEMLGL